MQSRSTEMLKQLESGERICALALGILFLTVGLIGFIPGLTHFPEVAGDAPLHVPGLRFDDGYGYVLGLFPTNFLHNAIHIVVGILGIAAATSVGGSIIYNQGFAIAYALITLMGILPMTNTTFGAMPIFGNNVWFNALTGIIAGYFGFVKPAALKAKMADEISTPMA